MYAPNAKGTHKLRGRVFQSDSGSQDDPKMGSADRWPAGRSFYPLIILIVCRGTSAWPRPTGCAIPITIRRKNSHWRWPAVAGHSPTNPSYLRGFPQEIFRSSVASHLVQALFLVKTISFSNFCFSLLDLDILDDNKVIFSNFIGSTKCIVKTNTICAFQLSASISSWRKAWPGSRFALVICTFSMLLC